MIASPPKRRLARCTVTRESSFYRTRVREVSEKRRDEAVVKVGVRSAGALLRLLLQAVTPTQPAPPPRSDVAWLGVALHLMSLWFPRSRIPAAMLPLATLAVPRCRDAAARRPRGVRARPRPGTLTFTSSRCLL